MADRKVYVDVDVTVRLIINMDEGIEVTDVINNCDYSFTSTNEGVDIIDTEIKDFEVMDSK